MNNTIVIRNREPQEISISGGGEVYGITTVYVNGIDVTDGSVAYVVVPTKTSELTNDSGFITQETDPTVPYYIKQITQADISNWNNKQASLVSGVNIKTINGNSVLGSGNMNISTSYTAGTGIEISNQNVINNTVTSYNDLEDLPTIPSYTSQLVNDSNFVVSSQLSNVAFSGSYIDLSNTPEIPAFTSELTNDGEDGDNPFITNKTNSLENYYNKEFMWNMLPKLTDSDTIINLTPTVLNAPMYLSLSPSELSQDGTPTPSSPQDIHTISGSNKVVVNGKQYIDNTNLSYNYSNVSSSYNTLTTIDTGIRYKTTYNNGSPFVLFKSVDLTPYIGKTIRFKANFGTKGRITLALCNADVTSRATIQASTTSGNTISYVVPNNLGEQKYLAYYLGIVNATGNDTEDFTNLIITIDNEDMTYTPYTLETADVDLGDIEYCKIGTYEDKFIRSNDGTWQLEKNIGKVIFNGSEENWSMGNATGGKQFSRSFSYQARNNTLCSMFVKNNDATSQGTTNAYYFGGGQIVFVRPTFNSTEIDTLTGWTSFLTDNNVIVYYVLSTPTYTPITGTLAEQLENVYQKMLSQKGQTNISQINNDLPFVITATTLKSLINV